ncbi:MAG: hypothetical protein P1U82_12515 [Verrucomicrobiales bacterium]|jgi:hypothetical protein|nr:hypothetical protein [Verrucomicrobiales bacterium]
MSLFDFFFSEWAKASHLRRIAVNADLQERRQRVAHYRDRHTRLAEKSTTRKVEKLEDELGQSTLVIEALIELLEESGTMNNSAIATLVHELDALDGVVDERVTPEASKRFKPNRKWDDHTNE